MTPTREQVIEWAEEAGAIQLHEEGWGPVIQGSIGDMQRFAVLAMERAHAAGREQGLMEAAAKVRAILADCEARDVDDPELEQVAQDIEQLRSD